MMATVAPLSSSSLVPLLESLEDGAAVQSEQTDAYLTIANRLNGDEGRQFLPAVVKHFSRLSKAILSHINSPNAELSQAALQSLGFCVYHATVVSGIKVSLLEDILSQLCSLVVTSKDKNTCTRALWVISKQSFPTEVVAKKVPSILDTLESVRTREDVQSVVMEHEALNVVIRLLEQAPPQMGEGAVRWAKLVIPLVIHSAPKVRLRAAAGMEMGLPLLLEKQTEVAAIIEPMMSTKIIPELQKLFKSKNEANVLKLWPLFVKLLGKLLHKGGPFINALLQLEEMGFRSSSPSIKKIAFIAWKSLIDNFALVPEILSSAKRLKLLMQPLNIHVRTEVLLLTKLEVWWYLVVRLGPNLAPNFEQIAVPLLQASLGSDCSVPGTPARGSGPNSTVPPGTPKNSSANLSGFPGTPNTSLNSSIQPGQSYPSIQLLGLEMLLHYLLGPDVVVTAVKNKLQLGLEPLTSPFLSGLTTFTKHAPVLISSIRDGFITVGKDAPDVLLVLIWKNLVGFVSATIEHAGSKKERPGCEALTLMLQALQSIVASEALPADKVLVLLEATVKGVPQRVLGSASYQVGKMDVLNGTPALFLIQLIYSSNLVAAYVENERFFVCLETLVSCSLSGPTSPLAFGEAVLGAIKRCAPSLGNKELMWRMWSIVVTPLTDTITQTNEVNQGDALEHNFSAMYSALMFPIIHLLSANALPQMTQKSMLSTWSKLYRVFARCAALVATAEENICCEEMCAKMAAAVDRQALAIPTTLDAVVSILQVMVECVDFSPYTPQFQQKMKSPRTPINWKRKKNKALGNLSTYQSLLVQCLESFLSPEDPKASSEATGLALVSILSTVFTNLALATPIQEALSSVTPALTLFYKQASETAAFSSQLVAKLEKLLAEVLGCLQNRTTLAYDDELLVQLCPLLCVLFPHKNKQLRAHVTQFWNATFANTVDLSYADELRPILSQAKQKTPLILPGFEAVSLPDELSAQDSSEGSQLDTKLSGVQMSSAGKRDSLLARADELKGRSTRTPSKPVSTKLDFGSPKPPRRQVLEEESSIDFVFIPPEAKERVLTEHQKEVKGTKRVDIPAMYNNLDASLDTSVFTQYTQSQEEAVEKSSVPEQTNSIENEASAKVPQEDVEMDEAAEMVTGETQDYISPEATHKKAREPDEQDAAEMIVSESADISTEDDNGQATTGDLEMESKDGTSPNVSGSSDMISGTPQKSVRRQSFITLEKYVEGKPVSPISVTKFTGPLNKTSNRQKHSATSSVSQASPVKTKTPPQATQPSEAVDTGSPPCDVSKTPEVSQQESVKPSGKEKESELSVSNSQSSEATEDEEEIIGDTQTKMEKSKTTSAGEDSQSESALEDSLYSPSQASQDEPRRSGRHRPKTKGPGEKAEGKEGKDKTVKKKHLKEEVKDTSLNDSQLSVRSSRRIKQAAEAKEEDSSKDNKRTRSQKDKSESSQANSQTNSQGGKRRKTKLYSETEDLLFTEEPKRDTSSQDELSQTDSQTDAPSDKDSQSQGKRRRRSKVATETAAETEDKDTPKERNKDQEGNETNQMDSQAATPPQPESQSQLTADRSSSKAPHDSNEPEIVEQNKKLSQDVQLSAPPTQSDSQSQGRTSRRNKSIGGSEEPNQAKRKRNGPDEDNSQDDSEIQTASDTESQSTGRSTRRSKTAAEVVEKGEPDGKRRGRPRKSDVQQEDQMSSNSPSSLPSSAESSQSKSRYSRRRSSQGLLSNMETSESDSSENLEELPPAKRRSRKLLPSPLTLESGEPKVERNISTEHSESSPKDDPQNVPNSSALKAEIPKDSEDLLKSPRPPLVTKNSIEQIESPQMEVESVVIKSIEPVSQEKSETENTKPTAIVELDQDEKSKVLRTSPRKKGLGQRLFEAKLNIDNASSQESDTAESQVTQDLLLGGTGEEQLEERLPSNLPVPSAEVNSISRNTIHLIPLTISLSPLHSGSSTSTPTCSGETAEKLNLLVSESSEEKGPEEPQPVEVTEEPVVEVDLEAADVPVEDRVEEDATVATAEQDQSDGQSAVEEIAEEQEQLTAVTDDQPDVQEEGTTGEEMDAQGDDQCDTSLQEMPEEGDAAERQDKEEEDTQIDNVFEPANVDLVTSVNDGPESSEAISKEVCQDSPVKQKFPEGVSGLEDGQSPSSGRTRGIWSPSASPSTSILKKGQKRTLEEESPSPHLKSRRVSFADPIQHQELADDIDRRSPVIRTSSPRTKTTGIPQPYNTTPTKGPLMLSPRNLHSPRYKSSKKCLISEMSREPRAIPKDCVYPALVGCSAPVEAVLPQITSNMWPRGFGQLVRARNIKTVGDLSALTPTDIKTLPIRSPKIFNVKKALRAYEQRKGRGTDELKSFDETEKMTSEPEEPSTTLNHEEDKTSGESLAMELVDDPMPVDQRTPEADASSHTPEVQPKEQVVSDPLHPEDLLSKAEALSSGMTPEELGRCSSEQLVNLHDHLGGMLRSVVLELHTRLSRRDDSA